MLLLFVVLLRGDLFSGFQGDKMAMNPVGSLRRRPGLVGLLIAIPCIIILLTSSPDMTSEHALAERLADLQMKLQQFNSMHRAQREEVQVLSHHLAQFLLNAQADNVTMRTLETALSPEIRLLLQNVTGLHGTGELLRLPSIYHFLPHLLESPSSLRLGFQLSKGRSGVSIVLGIPSVKREYQTYVLGTLRNLVNCMNPKERNDTLIVVLIAETDMDYVIHISNQIEIQFAEHLHSGLIDVIAPHSSYYPDLNNLKQTLGDSPERVKWRSKQNLDFALLMMYCQSKATFYVQLEDDILAKKNFITTMKTFALKKIAKKDPWFVLVFCQLGFIGKMFRCVELPMVIQFFLMFFNDKPVDWLLDDLLTTRVCRMDLQPKDCKVVKTKLWVTYKPSLFQHIGTHSSLKGKVQKLKDKQFGKVTLFHPHWNPEAKVESVIKHYKDHTFERAYKGNTFFWGLKPYAGDVLTITFDVPTTITGYLFRSGNIEHPNDMFVNTTVEALPVASVLGNSTADGYVVLGEFDSGGIARGHVHVNMGPIKVLRLHVHSDIDNWVILSEILIEKEKRR
ncbi:hypothetical protein RUM44_010017 [Polyplax serrata]|uniref:Alpha-1,3-mannosyl-glycoprotein 4-beta-N-acetylglucosaminyltransferase B n=1 Tax=Polyplax serrata TaxID=468196 RepID=A0ABR1AUC1_POLSC